MKNIYPTLMIGGRFPVSDNVVTILEKLQMQSDRIVRTAANAVITSESQPRVLYFSFHNIQ